MIPDKVYDVFKHLCVIVLPALSVLYSNLAATWNLPFAEQIPQTITAVSLCLGACMKISKSEYNKRIGGGTGHDA